MQEYQGNVFDMASLQLLAIKPKTWRDLVSDEPFEREDIVTIQVCRDLSVVLGYRADLAAGPEESRCEGFERV